LDDIVGSVHVNKDVFVLELVVFVAHEIVDERLLGSTEMAAKHQEFAIVVEVVLPDFPVLGQLAARPTQIGLTTAELVFVIHFVTHWPLGRD
jgi:hypothetical protein